MRIVQAKSSADQPDKTAQLATHEINLVAVGCSGKILAKEYLDRGYTQIRAMLLR